MVKPISKCYKEYVLKMAKTTAKQRNYKKPPITEAVLEVRFNESISEVALEKLAFKQKSTFTIQKLESAGIRLSSDGKKPEALDRRLEGYKLIENIDSANIIQFKPKVFSISRLAPYQGWDELIKNFRKYYKLYVNKKNKSISRIGIRFINRIDIPKKNRKLIEEADYLNIYPQVPKKKFPPLFEWSIHTVSKVDDSRSLSVNSYTYNEEILIDHVSIILDLDVFQVENLPINEKSLYNELNKFRDTKNKFFEMMITPECRRLFK